VKGYDLFAESPNITVRDPQLSKAWYCQIFDVLAVDPSFLGLDPDEQEGCVFLGPKKGVVTLVLVPGDPLLNACVIACPNVERARQFLINKSVVVGETTKDRAGTRLFEFRDAEGNRVEFYEDH
jgi:hypothetical protein